MNMKNYNNLKFPAGSSLVMVLWIFVLLTVITAVIAQTSRLDTRISALTGDKLRCKWACRAGMETVIGILNDDEPESDCLGDLWSDNPDDLEDVALDGCSFSTEVIDEAGKLYINVANKKMLMYLPDMTEEIANAIIDWRDKDDDIRTGSAEGGYYQNIPYPYRIKNKAFTSIRELLRVKDVTEELFYGPKTKEDFNDTADDNVIYNEGWINYLTCYSWERNLDAEGNKRLDINKASENKLMQELGLSKSYAKWIVDNRKKGFKSLGDLISSSSPDKAKSSTENSNNAAPLDVETALSLMDKVTISTRKVIRGKININTASKVVLLVLFDGKEEIADDVIAYRQGQLFGIETFEQLADIASLKKNILKKTIDLICIRSGIFTIRTTARADLTDTMVQTEAVVDRSKSPVQIIYFCQGAKY